MEYRAHIRPVAARAVDWDGLSLSAGLARSAIPAKTRPHLKAGAQKKIVCGPENNGKSHTVFTQSKSIEKNSLNLQVSMKVVHLQDGLPDKVLNDNIFLYFFQYCGGFN